ncbi:unnamed protein product [Adineta ricciae]|uniref:Uncharacterized protein n=1 Tax=Adineta ricciae TaxID=249248 RepID=A0A814Q1X4_ADIRI|nr:unnamed protein product [Adineta ricciae]
MHTAESSKQSTFTNNHDFGFFDKTRIDKNLLLNQPFVDALSLVESTIGNPNLPVKLGQTCVTVLRNDPLFDLRKCRRHITEIYMHLIKVCQNINFELGKFTDAWSTFDIITIDKATVIDATMHGLTGEAGNSIERHFFGSVADAIGHFTDNTQSIYLIDHIILRERQKKDIHPSYYGTVGSDRLVAGMIDLGIKENYFRMFYALDFRIITCIPIPDTETRTVTSPLKNPTSDNKTFTKKRPVTDLSPEAARICTFLRLDSVDLVKALVTSDDEEDQPILSAAGKLRYPAILHKT